MAINLITMFVNNDLIVVNSSLSISLQAQSGQVESGGAGRWSQVEQVGKVRWSR